MPPPVRTIESRFLIHRLAEATGLPESDSGIQDLVRDLDSLDDQIDGVIPYDPDDTFFIPLPEDPRQYVQVSRTALFRGLVTIRLGGEGVDSRIIEGALAVLLEEMPDEPTAEALARPAAIGAEMAAGIGEEAHLLEDASPSKPPPPPWGSAATWDEITGLVVIGLERQSEGTLVVTILSPSEDLPGKFIWMETTTRVSSVHLTSDGQRAVLRFDSERENRSSLEYPLFPGTPGNDLLIRNGGALTANDTDQTMKLLAFAGAVNEEHLASLDSKAGFHLNPDDLWLKGHHYGKVVSIVLMAEERFVVIAELRHRGKLLVVMAEPDSFSLVRLDNGLWRVEYRILTPDDAPTITQGIDLHPKQPAVTAWIREVVGEVSGSAVGAASFPLSLEQAISLLEQQPLSALEEAAVGTAAISVATELQRLAEANPDLPLRELIKRQTFPESPTRSPPRKPPRGGGSGQGGPATPVSGGWGNPVYAEPGKSPFKATGLGDIAMVLAIAQTLDPESQSVVGAFLASGQPVPNIPVVFPQELSGEEPLAVAGRAVVRILADSLTSRPADPFIIERVTTGLHRLQPPQRGPGTLSRPERDRAVEEAVRRGPAPGGPALAGPARFFRATFH
ncbi:MAG: hypothetical protein HYS22_02820 [Deltaproteobacteria bacterium]|nr:hypothetical protein [Deltaproteobacteria bacterium]